MYLHSEEGRDRSTMKTFELQETRMFTVVTRITQRARHLPSRGGQLELKVEKFTISSFVCCMFY